MKLSHVVQSLITGSPVDKQQLLNQARRHDELMEASKDLLDQCYNQVGMHLGSKIKELTAQITGSTFNEKEFYHERLPDGQ